MVANTSKRRLSRGTKIMRKPLAASNFKPKIVVKENDRITRMKAAREAYSKLSRDRSQKSAVPSARTASRHDLDKVNGEAKENQHRCNDSPSFRRNTVARDFVFKPVEESLHIIRNGGIRMTSSGRYNSLGGIRSSKPRPSLLPLGINVFDSQVSASDKEKVRDFLSARCNTVTTPKKAVGSPFTSNNTIGHYSLRSLRSVRFHMEAAIEEQRESDGDGVLQTKNSAKCEEGFKREDAFKHPSAPPSILKSWSIKALMDQEPSTSILATSGKKAPDNTFNREGTPAQEDRLYLAKSGLAPLQSPLPSNASNVSDFGRSKTEYVKGRFVPDFAQCYAHLFNMSDEEWNEVEPIMVNELADLLEERRKRINDQVSVMNSDISESLPSLSHDILPCEPKKTGFRKIHTRQKQSSSTDLQANQEIVLINEAARNSGGSSSRSLRSRLKDPVSRILGGDSPFAPIRDSPL